MRRHKNPRDQRWGIRKAKPGYVAGLYPEHHDIVGNQFYDPEIHSQQEPVWYYCLAVLPNMLQKPDSYDCHALFLHFCFKWTGFPVFFLQTCVLNGRISKSSSAQIRIPGRQTSGTSLIFFLYYRSLRYHPLHSDSVYLLGLDPGYGTFYKI